MGIEQALQEVPNGHVIEVPRWAFNQRHLIVGDQNALRHLLNWMRQHDYLLYTIIATDNRLLIERTYKLYYLLSSSQEDELVILEYRLSEPDLKEFASIKNIFPAAAPFEYKIRDLFGLKIKETDNEHPLGFLLHTKAYPLDFAPLSRQYTLSTLKERLSNPPLPPSRKSLHTPLPRGMFIVPVGPIHAGVIEAGHFPFHVAGEVIEKMPVTLGYKHRGIEKLFETHYTLLNGWQLAEKVSGDSPVAHAIAYCQAVEDLAHVSISEEVALWRAFLLELERIYNHISDIGLLAVGIAYEKAAARLSILRELFVHYINTYLSGNRFLRGLNRPGGVWIAPERIQLDKIWQYIEAILDESLDWGRKLLELPEVRERMINTGVLLREEARDATGLVARAAGWINYDSRLLHPSSAYRYTNVERILRQTILEEESSLTNRSQVYEHDLKGDVFARLAIRVAELETSYRLVLHWLPHLTYAPRVLEDEVIQALNDVPEMAMGIGYVEGWRGTVIYTLFKGPQTTIARCDVTDPSLVNWYMFAKSVIRKKAAQEEGREVIWENILADFPLINKSFNLSYAAHDL